MKVKITLKAKKDFGTMKVGEEMILINEVFCPKTGIAFFPIETDKWSVEGFDLCTGMKNIDDEDIFVNDNIVQVGKGISQFDNKPLKVCFGQYKAGIDDWDIEYCCTGFYVTFVDGGHYSLTQEGDGYSINAKKCKTIK